MIRWKPWEVSAGEVVAFQNAPSRFWHVRPVADRPGLFCGKLVHDEWTDEFEHTSTDAGPLDQVIAALKDRRWRQGLPIVVEGPAA